MFFNPLRFQRADLCCQFALCNYRGLFVKGDLVCGLEQVLRYGGHDHLCVGFGDVEVSCALKPKEPLHRAKAPFDAKVLLRDPLVKALLRLAQ